MISIPKSAVFTAATQLVNGSTISATPVLSNKLNKIISQTFKKDKLPLPKKAIAASVGLGGRYIIFRYEGK